MKQKQSSKCFPALLVLMLLSLLLTYGCEPESDVHDPSSGDPAIAGPFTKCTYSSNLSDSGYSKAVVSYPCETDQGPFAATTLTGGFSNTKKDVEWLGNHLVTHGYIIIAMTPNNVFGFNSSWQKAHNAGIAKLRSENTRAESPIQGLVRTADLQIMGFSKGGGGALLAAADQGADIRATQALAPYMDFSYDLSGIRSATIVHAGSSDIIASDRYAKEMFQALPVSVDRTLVNYRRARHLDWVGRSGNYRDRFQTYITSWMKVYLDRDASYQSYIDGYQDWFDEFVHYPAGVYPNFASAE